MFFGRERFRIAEIVHEARFYLFSDYVPLPQAEPIPAVTSRVWAFNESNT